MEEEPARGGRFDAGRPRGPGLEKLADGFGAFVALADGDEEADHRADLLVEDAVPPDDEGVTVSGLLDLEAEDRADGRVELAVGIRGERDEIVLADEIGRRLLHVLEVERTVAERPIGSEVRRQDVRLIELIPVLLALRGKPRVEVGLRIGSPEDSDGLGKAGVHRADEVLRRNRLSELEVPP